MDKININNFEEKMYYEKLSSGLEVFMIPLLKKNNFHCMFGTKFGGRDLFFSVDDKRCEVPSGIAHFLEHKLFEREDINPFEFYYNSGTDVNAHTTNEYTGYYFNGNTNFYDNLSYLLNWITSLSIDEKQVAKEKGIILEEASMYKDDPNTVLFERLRANVIVSDPERNKIIGSDEDIKTISLEDLELCYKSFYRPDNMFIICVGQFDPFKTIKLIRKELKNFTNPNEIVKKIITFEEDTVYKEYEEVELEVKTSKVGINFKLNKGLLSDLKISNYMLQYYFNMIFTLSFGLSSEFREELLNKHLIVSSEYNISTLDNHYIFEFYVVTEKPNAFIKRFKSYINNINLLEENFLRMKKTWIASEVRTIDNIGITTYSLIDDIINYEEFKNNKIKDIKKMNYETLIKVLKKFNFDNCSILKIKPKK